MTVDFESQFGNALANVLLAQKICLMSFFKKDDPEVDGRWIERMRHSPPEQVEVIEFVIKVVENLADLEARVERINCFISLVERLGESSEHMGKGDIGFPVSVITRRIVDKGAPCLSHDALPPHKSP